MPKFCPKVQVVSVCGFWLFAVIPKHSSGACGQEGGRVHSQISELEQLHNTFSLFQRRAELLGSLITCSEHSNPSVIQQLELYF